MRPFFWIVFLQGLLISHTKIMAQAINHPSLNQKLTVAWKTYPVKEYIIEQNTPSSCTANAGTQTLLLNGSPTSSPIYLNQGDCYDILTDSNFVLPAPTAGESAELMYAFYTGIPNLGLAPDLDSNFTGSYWTGDDFSDCYTFSSIILNSGLGNHVWIVPVTMDDSDNNGNPNSIIGYDNNNDTCFALGTPIEVIYMDTMDCVWPGDTNNDNIANNFDLLPIGLHHGDSGTIRTNATINWTCQSSFNWGTSINGSPTVDIKHVDTDGNSLINHLDINAILQNWSQTHLKNGNSSNSSGVDVYIDTATANPGDTLTLDIILGSNLVPTNGYGIAFTINYDSIGIDTNGLSISFDNSWLGNINTNLKGIFKVFENTNQIEVALTKIDQNSVVGGGPIAEIQFIIKNDVLSGGSFARLGFEITNVQYVDSVGNVLLTNTIPSEVLVLSPLGDNLIKEIENTIIVSPNPTNGKLRVESLNQLIDNIKVYDTMGQMLFSESAINELQTLIDISFLPRGVYILNVESGGQVKNIRIVKG